MNNFKVIGIVSGVSNKSGSPKPYTMLHCITEFDQNSAQEKKGQECIIQYLPMLTDSNIIVGSVVEFEYGIKNGFPRVCGVHLKK